MVLKRDILYVDGYNMIGAWPELVKLKNIDQMADARDLLLKEMSHYAKYEKVDVRVVFDAQFVPGLRKKYDHYNLSVIFTAEDETADSYIESSVGNENLLISNVVVATSDLAEQWIVFQKGASRKSANELYKDIKRTKKNIQLDAALYQMHQKRRNSPFKEKDELRLKELYQELTQLKEKKE